MDLYIVLPDIMICVLLNSLDIAANVVSPLFNAPTMQTLKTGLTPKQEQAIQSLGSAWNLSRYVVLSSKCA